MSVRSLQAQVATSEGVKRQRIEFDENSGLIIKRDSSLQVQCDYEFSDDCLLFGGMGDIHIHAREDISAQHCYKENYQSARLAGLNGGLTSAGDMPNNPVAPIDDSSYLAKRELLKVHQFHFFQYAGIGPGTNPLSFPVPYKAYMGPSVGELFFKDQQQLRETIASYQGQVVSFHCEDPEILNEFAHQKTHADRRPVQAEVLATRVALSLIEDFQLKGKLCHYSAGEGLKLISEAKAKGLSVQCEVTPQHLYFDQSNIPAGRETYFQMNPPIRGPEDRISLLKAFKAGEIDFLATDHAPHSPEEKKQGTSGMTGLDTFGPFVTWLLIDQKISPEIIALTCVENPGRFINQFISVWQQQDAWFKSWGKGLGFLEPGFAADFTVLNLKKSYRVEKENLKTLAKDSPFIGIEFPGSVEAVFFSGKPTHVRKN